MDITTLPPDAKEELLARIASEHPEYLESENPVDKIQALIQSLSDRLTNIEEHVTKLESLVMDQIIGGLTDLYGKAQREQGISGIREKYGDLFNPLSDGFSFAAKIGGKPDADMFSSLYDLVDGMKKDGTWSEESELSKMQESAQQLADFLSELKSAPDVPVMEKKAPDGEAAEEAPAVVEVGKVPKPSASKKPETPSSMDDKMKALAAQFKSRGQ